MKKHIPFLLICAVIIFVGYFWLKSHEGDEDVVRARQAIEAENYKNRNPL